jgi:hypothetical protein
VPDCLGVLGDGGVVLPALFRVAAAAERGRTRAAPGQQGGSHGDKEEPALSAVRIR